MNAMPPLPHAPALLLQAFGAGNLAALGPLLQRTLLFLAVHAAALTGVLLLAPQVLARQVGPLT